MQVKACFFILYCFIAKCCVAQLSLRPFRFLTTDNGLSQAINYSILKDSKDFIWVTSYDGLNRFDSRKIITYRNLLQDSSSFKGTLSIGLIEDVNNNIWCGSNDALNVYFRNSNSFKQIKVPGQANDLYIPITTFNNNVFFKRGNKLFTADINTLSVQPISLDKPIDIFRFSPKVFETQHSIFIYFLSKPLLSSSQFTSGFKLVEIQKNNITNAKLVYNQQDEFQYYDVEKKDNGRYLFCSSNGLREFNIELKALTFLSNSLSQKKVIACTKIKNGIILSVKKEGLYLYNEDTDSITTLRFINYADEVELKKLNAEILYVDKNNFLWLSLWGKGLGYVDLSPIYFNHYFTETDLQSGKIKDRYIVSIKCDKSGNAWLSTKTDGIYYINQQGIILKHIPYPDIVKQIPFGDTYVFKGINESFFIASQYGVYKVAAETNTLRKINLLYNNKLLNGINDIAPLNNNQYLLCTQTGVFQCNQNFEDVTLMSQLSDVDVSLRSSIVNNKWLVICKPFIGAKIFSITNNQYIPYDSVTINTSIKHIHFQPDSNILWMASTIGIIKYYIQSKKYLLINNANTLSNTYTYSVLADDINNLWISHNKGITELNPLKNVSKHFTKSDGLQGNEFNTNSFDRAQNNTMYFGGTNGLNIFSPTAVDSININPTLQILDFKINDILQRNKYTLSNNDTIHLAYKQNTFSFIPLVINYYNGEDDECLYKIEGVDESWLEGRSNTLIRYSNLSYGNYILKIKAKNSKHEVQIHFIIKKPFWQTIWFTLLVAATIAFIIWLFIRSYYIKKANQQKSELEKQIALQHERTRIATDMHDDLGSGLTKITYLSQMALNKADVKDELNSIKNTSTELVHNMSEIIWAMKEENNSLEDLVYYIKNYALEYCHSNNLSITINLPENLYNREVAGQNRRHIYLAIKEVLHNIVKHAKAKNVTMNASYNEKEWIISIKDDGVGIGTQLKNGNGLKNITKRIEQVNGKVDFITANGTEVKMHIPL